MPTALIPPVHGEIGGQLTSGRSCRRTAGLRKELLGGQLASGRSCRRTAGVRKELQEEQQEHQDKEEEEGKRSSLIKSESGRSLGGREDILGETVPWP